MSSIQYTCRLFQRHMALAMKRDKTPSEVAELYWLKYKLRLVRNAQRKVLYGRV